MLGGQSEVYEKGAAEKKKAMLKGRHNKFWGIFNMGARSFSHIEEGCNEFLPFEKGAERCTLPRWGGGAQEVLDPWFSHFVAPPRY